MARTLSSRSEWSCSRVRVPFIYTQGLRELIFKLSSRQNIKLCQENERAVTAIASHGEDR